MPGLQLNLNHKKVFNFFSFLINDFPVMANVTPVSLDLDLFC